MTESMLNELPRRAQVESFTGFSGLSRDGSRACMVADTLAWAATHNMPLPNALRCLPFFMRFRPPSAKKRRFFAFLRDSFAPFRPLFWLMNIRWSWNLNLAIQDLENGHPLSSALERNLRRHFPSFYLTGLARAERDNRLDAALPVLARQLIFPDSVAGERKPVIFFVALKILLLLNIFVFVGVNVVPKFTQMFDDLLDGQPAPGLAMWNAVGFVWPTLKIGGALLVSLLILLRIEGIGEYVAFCVPFVGRERRRFALGDLARSMAVFIRQGEDVLSAAQWSMKATRSHWLRKRIEVFVSALSSGENWTDAWAKMRLGEPLHEWIIRNAAMREDPATGFETLADWLTQEIGLTTGRIDRWLDPICTFFVAAGVGCIAYYVFNTLSSIILAMSY